MENLKLEVQIRKKEEDTKEMIKAGFVPAVVYGPKLKENKLVKIKTHDLIKAFEKAGEATLIDLSIDGKVEGKVLFKEDQRDAVKDNIIHIDLYEVDMTKEIHAEIPLHFVGESAAVKESAGVLVKNISEVEVRCLPGDLVSHIEVDLSALVNLHDVIKMHDLKLPAGIELVNETDDVVITVTEVKIVEEISTEVPKEEAVEGAPAAEKAGEGDKEKKEEKGK